MNFLRCLRFFHTLKKQLVIKFNSFLFKLNKHISKDIKLLSCKSSAIGHIPFLYEISREQMSELQGKPSFPNAIFFLNIGNKCKLA